MPVPPDPTSLPLSTSIAQHLEGSPVDLPQKHVSQVVSPTTQTMFEAPTIDGTGVAYKVCMYRAWVLFKKKRCPNLSYRIRAEFCLPSMLTID